MTIPRRRLGRTGLGTVDVQQFYTWTGSAAAAGPMRAHAIIADLGIEEDALADVALRFCLAAPAVSAVIAGMRPPAIRSPGEQLAVLHRHRWDRPAEH